MNWRSSSWGCWIKTLKQESPSLKLRWVEKTNHHIWLKKTRTLNCHNDVCVCVCVCVVNSSIRGWRRTAPIIFPWRRSTARRWRSLRRRCRTASNSSPAFPLWWVTRRSRPGHSLTPRGPTVCCWFEYFRWHISATRFTFRLPLSACYSNLICDIKAKWCNFLNP